MNDHESGEPDGLEEALDPEPSWSRLNWAIIAIFSALTIVGIVLAMGAVEAFVEPAPESGLVTIPLYIYLYSGLGALGYIFTKLMVQLDRYTEWNNVEELVGMVMRIPAAWILATGIFLLLNEIGQPGSDGAQFAAGVAFLVGLYVNVAMKGLGSLADRILGRGP